MRNKIKEHRKRRGHCDAQCAELRNDRRRAETTDSEAIDLDASVVRLFERDGHLTGSHSSIA
jgi:hypothetical protein